MRISYYWHSAIVQWLYGISEGSWLPHLRTTFYGILIAINNIYITSDQDWIISYCKALPLSSGAEENGKISQASICCSIRGCKFSIAEKDLLSYSSSYFSLYIMTEMYLGVCSWFYKYKNILTGKCMAKIHVNDPNVHISPRNRPNASTIWSTVEEALEDITGLFYDEERKEIYTGDWHGLVHVWSNLLMSVCCAYPVNHSLDFKSKSQALGLTTMLLIDWVFGLCFLITRNMEV